MELQLTPTPKFTIGDIIIDNGIQRVITTARYSITKNQWLYRHDQSQGYMTAEEVEEKILYRQR